MALFVCEIHPSALYHLAFSPREAQTWSYVGSCWILGIRQCLIDDGRRVCCTSKCEFTLFSEITEFTPAPASDSAARLSSRHPDVKWDVKYMR
jgi:hypothetical protein